MRRAEKVAYLAKMLEQTAARGWLEADELKAMLKIVPGFVFWLAMEIPGCRPEGIFPKLMDRYRKLLDMAERKKLTLEVLGKAIAR